MENIDFKAMLTLKEAQAVLGVSTAMINQLVHQKGFPSFKVGRLWRIDGKRLFVWIRDRIQEKDEDCIF